ncbi:MAG: hypothetical protein HQ536_01190 [Parcubacteria group bacterium]|nr:hypothetical protein [Parcubacteria group bacterium]
MKLTRNEDSCPNRVIRFVFTQECEDDLNFTNDIIRWVKKIKKILRFHPTIKRIEISHETAHYAEPLEITVIMKK